MKAIQAFLLMIAIFLMVCPVMAETTKKTYVVSFAGSPAELAGFDETIRLWFAIFTIIFVAMFAGASHSPQIAVVDIVMAWIYLGIGWLNPLTVKVGAHGEGVLVIMLSFATMYVIAWNFREGKRKEKGT